MVIDSAYIGGAYKRDRWAGPDSWALVGEGGVIPLQLGLPGSTLPVSAPAHPFFHLLLVAVVCVAAAGAYVFLYILFLLLFLSLIFPTPWRFKFLDGRDRREVLVRG